MKSTSTSAPRSDATPLSRDAVVDHALALADVDGPAAVSIRRIAQDFGVTPMALYWHVKNKDELLAAMGDRILESVDLPEAEPGAGLEELHVLLTALVAALHRHPGCTALAQQRVLVCDRGRVLAERSLDILRRNGFGVRQSADLSRAALQTAIMLVSGRPGAETSTPQDERAAVLAQKRAALVGLPADRFPHLVECADALTECDDEAAYYGAGIDLFMAGVTTLADRQAVHR
ncbi:TetR/AcrR family transcriptional regulator [Nakamurella sp. GG22]